MKSDKVQDSKTMNLVIILINLFLKDTSWFICIKQDDADNFFNNPKGAIMLHNTSHVPSTYLEINNPNSTYLELSTIIFYSEIYLTA